MTIIIPTYFYKPCNLTPVNRIHSWVEYFSKKGIYVVVITRHWKTELDEFDTFDKPLEIKKFDNYEVHYLPYKGNWRTKIKHNNKLIVFFRKFLTLLEILSQNSFDALIPYKNIISYTKKTMLSYPNPFLIISGNPFALFKIGYFAATKHNIPWIADYRDGWTESPYSIRNEKKFHHIIYNINLHFEKKWVATAKQFITVSNFLVSEIEKVVPIKGTTIYNGFIGQPKNNSNINYSTNTTLQILYSGEIYKLQDYPTLISICKQFIDAKNNLKLIFLGANTSNHKIDTMLVKNYEESIEITNRLPHAQALEIQENVDCFIMLGHGKLKGGASSKMFDYMQKGKKFILYTSDHDILEEIAIKSNLGIIANDETELKNVIEQLLLEKKQTGIIASNPNWDYINVFTRENQAKILHQKILEHRTNAI
jgi:glycosyltransferase involved in cell wall biosynthesis